MKGVPCAVLLVPLILALSACAQSLTPTPVSTPTLEPKPLGRILFEGHTVNFSSNVYVMDENGANVVKVADAGKDPLWSPDGQWIAFISTASGDSGALYAVRPDGTGLTIVTPRRTRETMFGTKVLNFVWSLDGRFLLYRSRQDMGGDPAPELRVIGLDGTKGVGVALPGVFRLFDTLLTWSSEGPRAALWLSEGVFIQDLTSGQRTDAIEVAAEFGGLQPNLAWTPDGTKLLYQTKDGYYSVNWDGSLQRKVTPKSKSERLLAETSVVSQ